MDKREFERRAMAQAKLLHGIAYAMLRREADCEDAISEALLRAWQKRQSLRQLPYFETWLTRILINVCKNMLRARRGDVEYIDRANEPQADYPQLQDALMSLPLKYRLPLVMHYIEGYAVAEIANLLRLPTTTIKWRMHAAREKLKTALLEGEDA